VVPLPELIEKNAATEALKNEDGGAWRFTHLRYGALGIFCSVGSEVAIGSILINFLGQPEMGGLSHVVAASYVSFYWGGAMVGRIIGSVALLKVKAQSALLTVASLAAVMVAITIFGHGRIAMWAIVSCGLFNSVMWPCIFPLAVKGLGKFTSQGSGILITMVVGGAIVPVLQGFLADRLGYQTSFAIVLLCYAYLVFFALSGYKIRQPRFASLPDYVPPAEI
jgi:FHS family L-fucose permease-like MFS transporter